MRPIKYRAFIKEGHLLNKNKIVDVLEIDFEEKEIVFETESSENAIKMGASETVKWCNKFENIVLLEFTGLHDRNGTEIYNLDVVKLRDSYYLVVYRFGSYDLTCIDHNVWGSPYFYGWRNQLERVCSLYEYEGVIHIKPSVLEVLPELGVFNQNPGLLKEE